VPRKSRHRCRIFLPITVKIRHPQGYFYRYRQKFAILKDSFTVNGKIRHSQGYFCRYRQNSPFSKTALPLTQKFAILRDIFTVIGKNSAVRDVFYR
jgi:hypothetical protein